MTRRNVCDGSHLRSFLHSLIRPKCRRIYLELIETFFLYVFVCVPNDDNKNVAQQFGRFKKSHEENRMDRPIHHVGYWRLTFVEILHRNYAEFEDFSL